LAAVATGAAIEWCAAALAYRDRFDEHDWQALGTVIEEIDPHEPVLLASSWLGPTARMELERLRGDDAVALPDLRGLPRFHVLGVGSARWSEALERELEDLTRPELVESRSIGPFTLATWALPKPGALVSDLARELDRVRVEGDDAACRGRGPWRCGEGKVGLRIAEIDYVPRRCIGIDVGDATTVRIVHPALATGNTLRGHVGVHDFNRRLRRDAPVGLAVLVDGRVRGRWVTTDTMGWWPFAVVVEPGTHEVAIEIDVSVRGTWTSRGHEPNEAAIPCVELRSFDEEAR
jgi:hypothetical protein